MGTTENVRTERVGTPGPAGRKLLTEEARRRLEWIGWYYRHGRNGRRTCRRFGISPDTLYKWLRRYDADDFRSLESKKSGRHGQCRPKRSPELEREVLALRQQYPRSGKEKLTALLRQQGWTASVSTVGRILTELKARGVFREASGRHSQESDRPVPSAGPRPKDYPVSSPGDVVEVEIKIIRPLPGVVLTQFIAQDVVSGCDVAEVHNSVTPGTASTFMDSIQTQLPFRVKALEITEDGGIEEAFDKACRERGVRLFLAPSAPAPASGHGAMALIAPLDRFYQSYDGDFSVRPLNKALHRWGQASTQRIAS